MKPFRASYAICTTPRTASEFLRGELRGARLGDPGEHVAENGYQAWVDLPELWAAQRQLSDVFGIKLFWEHRELRFYFADFEEVLPGEPKWVYLYRRNIEDQARSLLTAYNTGVWFSVRDPYLDYPDEQVDAMIARIRRWNQDWPRWFEWKGFPYITIVTEEFIADPAATIADLKQYILG